MNSFFFNNTLRSFHKNNSSIFNYNLYFQKQRTFQLFHYFIVYDFKDKIRLGSKSDGGYVFGILNTNYDCYISAGVSNEESFSRDFIHFYNLNSNNSFAFDGTILDYPYQYTKNISFFKKNINSFNDDHNTNLAFLTDKFNDIFLKMDIEGGEFPWLLSLSLDQLKKFKQIVIEFHGINDDSWNSNFIDKLKCLHKLNQTHYLIHAHGNNHSDVTLHFPDVLECTYVNKSYFDSPPPLNTTPLPIKNLDFPNCTHKNDFSLNFSPFVSKP